MKATPDSPASPGGRRARTRLRWLVHLVWVAAAYYFFQDEALIVHPERLDPRQSVTPETNAYGLFAEAATQAHRHQAEIRVCREQEWDTDRVEALLRTNAVALATFRRGLALPGCEFPPTLGEEDPILNVRKFLSLGSLLNLEARLFSAQRRTRESFAAITDGMRFADMCLAVPVGVESGLTGLGLWRRAFASLEDGLLQAEPSEHELSHLMERVADAAQMTRTYRAMVQGEMDQFRLALESHSVADLMGLPRAKLPIGRELMPWLFFRENRSRNLFALQYLAYAGRVDAPFLKAPFGDGEPANLRVLDDLQASLQHMSGNFRNKAGALLVFRFSHPANGIATEACIGAIGSDLARISLALRLHHLREGRYPLSLGDLSPAILPVLPLDRFDGESYGYDPEHGRVFSRWPLEEEGGKPHLILDALEKAPREPPPSDRYKPTQFRFARSPATPDGR